ncbi:MAG: rod shape-determining protein RodA [Actinobacteria bacterium RBG_13_63_9]|nr:MAG: rod shape-determining protein RodA [Actinobacteria bacterium RBG_13_63_9]
MDWILLAATLGLVAYGFFMLYSATQSNPKGQGPAYYLQSQGVGLAIGLVALFALSVFNYRWFARWQIYIYGASIFLLILTLIIGTGGAEVGARRWLNVGLFQLQAAELVKFLLILSLATVLMEGVDLRGRFRFVLLCILYVLIPGVLIFLQPDLGTSLCLMAILVCMLVVWGIRLSHLSIMGGVGVLSGVMVLRVLPNILGFSILRDYQLKRLTLFLHPDQDPKGGGYQLIQSKIAVGSGMFSGKGYMKGTQSTYGFIPEHHTDFIFSVIGEELGFLGAAVLILLFAIVTWRAYRICRLATDLYGKLVAAGIAGVLVFQVFTNIGMTTGIMPVVGLPLPFVSFGSSSLVVFLMAIGLLESVHVHSVAGWHRRGARD